MGNKERKKRREVGEVGLESEEGREEGKDRES